MSNLLDKSSILLTPTAYENGKILSVKPAPSLGSELVVNGDFATDSDWNVDSSCTIELGKANFLSSTSNAPLYQSSPYFTIGKTYKITYTISNYSTGRIIWNDFGAGAGNGIIRTANGTYTEYYLKVGTTTNFGFRTTFGFTGSIDNVSVKEVGQDWNLGTGWSIGNNKAIANNVPNLQRLQRAGNNPSVIGNTYKYSINISNVSGFYSVYIFGVYVLATSNTEGIIEGEFTATSTNGAFWVAGASASGLISATIENITILEITSDTNLPRIDYTGGEGHWLFEPQSSNLIPYSSDFSNASYSKANAGLGSTPIVTPDYATSPSGSQDADRIQFNLNSGIAGGDYSWIFTFPASDINGIVSIYLKTNDNTTKVVYFRNTFGTIDNITVTGNWQRYSIANTTTRGFYIGLRGAQGNSDTADLSVWGAQVEAQTFATSIIPTSGSTVTRLQDAAFGAGSSDLINSTEGVLYAEIAALADDLTNKQISLNNGTTDDRIQLYYSASSNQISVFYKSQSGATAFILNHTLSDITQFNKVGFKWKQNDFALWSNGVEVATQTSGVTSSADTLTKLDFQQFNGSADFYGKTKCLAVFKEALTDAELTCLTTT